MTSSPKPSSSPKPRPLDKESRRTSIAWTKLPEPPSAAEKESRRHSSLASASGTSTSLPLSRSSSTSVRGGRTLSSPPPPPAFINRVSFDTFDNKDASDFSLTLKCKHKNYAYTRRSRTFLCGTDQNDYSEFALEWLIDELVDDGDEIVCLRVVDKDSKISSDSAVQEGVYRQEAKKLLGQVIEKNEDEKAISIILEFSVGKVHETIQRMIHIYEPVILIVGTRGRSLGGLQGLLPGSVSKYCLQHSPVPVIVVRSTSKRDKKKAKRKTDPGRRVYQDILQSSGSTMLGGNHSQRNLPGSGGVTPSMSTLSLGTPTTQETTPTSSSHDISPKTLAPSSASVPPTPLEPSAIPPIAEAQLAGAQAPEGLLAADLPSFKTRDVSSLALPEEEREAKGER